MFLNVLGNVVIVFDLTPNAKTQDPQHSKLYNVLN